MSNRRRWRERRSPYTCRGGRPRRVDREPRPTRAGEEGRGTGLDVLPERDADLPASTHLISPPLPDHAHEPLERMRYQRLRAGVGRGDSAERPSTLRVSPRPSRSKRATVDGSHEPGCRSPKRPWSRRPAAGVTRPRRRRSGRPRNSRRSVSGGTPEPRPRATGPALLPPGRGGARSRHTAESLPFAQLKHYSLANMSSEEGRSGRLRAVLSTVGCREAGAGNATSGLYRNAP